MAPREVLFPLFIKTAQRLLRVGLGLLMLGGVPSGAFEEEGFTNLVGTSSESSALSKTGAGSLTLGGSGSSSSLEDVVIIFPPIFPPGPIASLPLKVFTATSHTFTQSEGIRPNALVRGQDGSWYGTTAGGGTNGTGAIFRLSGESFHPVFMTTLGSGSTEQSAISPDSISIDPIDLYRPPHGFMHFKPAFSQLYSFPANGGRPARGSLVCVVNGNLYGITTHGGSRGLGSVWKMAADGTVTTLHSFTGADGARPVKLILGKDGNLYGIAAGIARGEILVISSEWNLQDATTLRPALVDPQARQTTLFKVTPAGELTTLYTFPAETAPAPIVGGDLGFDIQTWPQREALPRALVEGSNGQLFASVGGTNVYRISSDGKEVVTLPLPAGCRDAENFLFDSDRQLFGTARGEAGPVVFQLFSGYPLGVVGTLPQDFRIRSLLLQGHYFIGTAATSSGGALFRYYSGPELAFGTPRVRLEVLKRWSNPNEMPEENLTLGEGGRIYATNTTGNAPLNPLSPDLTGAGQGQVVSFVIWPSLISNPVLNRAPIARDDSVRLDLDAEEGPGEDRPPQTYHINVLANDFDPDGDQLKVVSVSAPAVTISPDNTLIYTATEGLERLQSFTYTINDGRGGTATATVSVSYRPSGNRKPRARNDVAQLGWWKRPGDDGAIGITPLDNDTDSDGDALKIISVTQGRFGRVQIDGDGIQLSYAPGAHYRSHDTFTYTVTDQHGGTARATVTVRNPHVAVRGAYTGKLSSEDGKKAGSVRFNISTGGYITGVLRVGGQSLSFRDAMDYDGSVKFYIDSDEGGTMTMEMKVKPTAAGGLRLTGKLTDGETVYDLAGSRTQFSTAAGPYTIALPADPAQPDAKVYPQGAGFALVTVSDAGNVRMTGRLGDGTTFQTGGLMEVDGRLRVDLQTKTGTRLEGVIRFAEKSGGTDLSGTLEWKKPATEMIAPGGKGIRSSMDLYKKGFSGKITLIGSRYTPPKAGQTALANPTLSATLGAGNLASPLEGTVSLGTDDFFRVVTGFGGNRLGAFVARRTGLVVGSFVPSPASRPIRLQGVLLQNQNSVTGQFRGSTQTGYFTLAPR